MTVKDIIEKFKKYKINSGNSNPISSEVRDDRLTSLQRMRQKQLNEMEKKHLQKEVKEYNESKNHEFWMAGKAKKEVLYGKFNKKKGFLNDDRPILKQKKRFVCGNKIMRKSK